MTSAVARRGDRASLAADQPLDAAGRLASGGPGRRPASPLSPTEATRAHRKIGTQWRYAVPATRAARQLLDATGAFTGGSTGQRPESPLFLAEATRAAG